MNGTIARATTCVILATGILMGGAWYGKEGTATTQKQDESVYTTRNGGLRVNGTNGGYNPRAGRNDSQGTSSGILSGGLQDAGRQLTAREGFICEPSKEPAAPKPAISRGGNAASTRPSLGDFKVTNYTAGHESTGKRPGDKDYGKTATGSQVRAHYTIAADWDVLPPGTKVSVEGLPYTYVVEDSGGAVNGKHIDIYTPDLDRALAWGEQQRSVTVIEWGAVE